MMPIVKMHPLSIIVFFMLFCTKTMFSQTVLSLNSPETPVEIVVWHKQTYFVTTQNIYVVEKKTLKNVYHSTAKILATVATKSNFWLATKDGLLTTNDPSKDVLPFQKSVFPSDKTDFIALVSDPTKTDQIWVATRDNGIFVLNPNTEPHLMMNVLMLNDIAVTSPSDYWMGTDAGLVHRVNGQSFKYNEEGVAGFEIPDNIVDHLYIAANKLIVQMPDPLSIFTLAGEKTESHGTNLGFIGKKGNTIFDACALPDGSILFATAEGLTLLPQKLLSEDEAHHTGFHEVFAEANRPEARRIELSDLGFKSLDKNFRFKKIYADNQGNIWLASENTLFSCSLKKLSRLIEK